MEFVMSLYEKLERDLEQIREENENKICIANKSVTAIVSVMNELRDRIKKYPFRDQEEEILFFKGLKPKFSCLLIYHVKVQQIENRRPNGSHKCQCEYLSTELDRLKHFFDNNLEFYQYYRNQATHLDEKYFLRQPFDINLNLDPFIFDADPDFSTSHDYKVARLQANELLECYLNAALEDLELQQNKPVLTDDGKSKLTWTGSKAALIELLYALQSCGAFNSSKAEIKQIASYFEQAFNIDLGNYYRTFQEIRLRKKNRTSFIDMLKNAVIQKMDEIDECPNNSDYTRFLKKAS